ncbi:MAG: ParB N-terminal domain-containing protein, partial [Oscillospiraceae bacterium]|nr:ParB N-terminal domain-containing protein [Oscillospiraceae bacterium]
MAKKEFNLGDQLADVLKNVSDPDRGPEQIVLLPIAGIDADANNFYSMEGVEELAANIELIGLLDPLRVRENPDMPGRYLIVSGHRRRAAYWTLYEENPEKWAKAPCIIEPAAASPELQELRLIYANADTRKMSSADLTAQAERVEMLLYKLKDQGMEFPGRMRDHVAEACRISKTKLATLKAIKNNLIPELFAYYEKNEINESCAYELQKLPAEAQTAIANSCKRTGAAFIKGWGCERCVELADKYMAERKCENGDVCDHHGTRFVKTLRTNYVWAYCPGGCCVTCRALKDCDHACKKGKAVKAEKKTEEKAEKEKEKEKAEKEQKKEFQRKCKIRQSQAQRVLPLIEAAGLRDDDELEGNYYYSR